MCVYQWQGPWYACCSCKHERPSSTPASQPALNNSTRLHERQRGRGAILHQPSADEGVGVALVAAALDVLQAVLLLKPARTAFLRDQPGHASCTALQQHGASCAGGIRQGWAAFHALLKPAHTLKAALPPVHRAQPTCCPAGRCTAAVDPQTPAGEDAATTCVQWRWHACRAGAETCSATSRCAGMSSTQQGLHLQWHRCCRCSTKSLQPTPAPVLPLRHQAAPTSLATTSRPHLQRALVPLQEDGGQQLCELRLRKFCTTQAEQGVGRFSLLAPLLGCHTARLSPLAQLLLPASAAPPICLNAAASSQCHP